MISQVYAIYDVKALHYGAPFISPNVALAKRMVGDLANDMSTMVARHPADFKLYGLGFFDDEKGLITPFEIVEHVCDVITLVAPAAPTTLPFDVRTDDPKTYAAKGNGSGTEHTNGVL